MPHKQKENHDHSTRSKKERQRAKAEAALRKKKSLEARLAAELEEATKNGDKANNIALVDGNGAYEIGCEPEKEYKFNVRKRSKKHLRNDLRKKQEREEREEEERKKIEAEEKYRAARKAEQEEASSSSSSEVEEEEVIVEEYIIYICECCNKKYATQNQFRCHIASKKHQEKVRIYEDFGLIATHVELRGENGNEQEVYNDDDDDEEDIDDVEEADDDGVNTELEEEESEEEEEESIKPKVNLFAAFAYDSDSDSTSSSSSESEEDEHTVIGAQKKDKHNVISAKKELPNNDAKEEGDDYIDFDELIQQNQVLQDQIDADKKTTTAPDTPTPLPFHGTYDPENYGVNENRLAAVEYRLSKKLAAKGIEPRATTVSESYEPSDAVAVGHTLLQQVMEANVETLQTKLDAYNKHKKQCELLGREFAFKKGNSKALPAQYIRKVDAADDARKRANVHHAGSHYHMQAARSMQFGRSKGLMARHSAQGSRLQASRMLAKETARMHEGGGGMKKGKITSKKSNMKRRGR
eukprot:CAMPEP_0195520804 /NCGR_PEP_ID=MMETSP0794_2-20130614/17550_1 /TAXON_ID=515487 /ORGANISM="Stephanopyxis turris, Strain CCMP 815" /LENGTH=524 /DNA_ID=CAMNT_0040650227 /DNA_START=66 /DNA_END=1637 /DNA_ORIENTATION=+